MARWRAACSSASRLPCLFIPDGSSPNLQAPRCLSSPRFCSSAPGKEISVSRAVLASLVLGFSIHVRPANMVTVLVFIAAAAFLERNEEDASFRYRTPAVLLAVIGISGALYLARNYTFFGSPFDFGVPTTAENAKDLDSWRNPFVVGMAGFLFSPGKSVFLFCPPMVLGILGLPHLWRRNRALAVLAATAPIANLVLYSFRTQWEGSYCYGPRYLVPSLTLLCLPIAALLREPPRWFRPVFWITAIGGFLVQAIGLSTNILEDMARNHYYVGNWDYRMSYSPITGQLQLIWKYLHVQPTAVGLGWDRWFVLLRAAGASPSLMYGIASLIFAAALIFGFLTWRAVRQRLLTASGFQGFNLPTAYCNSFAASATISAFSQLAISMWPARAIAGLSFHQKAHPVELRKLRLQGQHH